jgi:rRNA processing protein Krr1/Pno1
MYYIAKLNVETGKYELEKNGDKLATYRKEDAVVAIGRYFSLGQAAILLEGASLDIKVEIR